MNSANHDCQRLCRYRGKRYTGWVHPDLELDHKVLDYPEEFVDGRAPLLLDCANRKIVRLSIGLRSRPTPVLLHFSQDQSLRRVFRRNYALRILDVSQQLSRKLIPTLDVLAALRKQREWLNGTSLVIAREIDRVQQLPSKGKHRLEMKPTVELNAELVRLLATSVAELHAENLFHGDLKSRHLLLETLPQSRFVFVDLEKSLHWPLAPTWLKDGLAARDLIQLLSSLPETPGDEPASVRPLLEWYLDARGLSEKRRNRISSWTGLYLNPGGFEQGKTVLENLLGYLKRRAKTSSPEGPAEEE